MDVKNGKNGLVVGIFSDLTIMRQATYIFS
jgi:hypothetical protein